MSKIVPLRKNEKVDTKSFHPKLCVKNKFEKYSKIKTDKDIVINTKNMKLLGPCSYFYYPNVNGRSILLIGDEHTPTTQCTTCNNNDVCMDINEYLTRIIRQDLVPDKEKKCIDFFVETSYVFSAKQKKNIKGGAPRSQKKCRAVDKQNISTTLPGLKGRFFDIDKIIKSKKSLQLNTDIPSDTKVSVNMSGVVCDKRGSKIKFEKYSKSKTDKRCVSRKSVGISKETLKNTQHVYLKLSSRYLSGIRSIPAKTILPQLDTLNFVRDNFNICHEDRDFCERAYPYLRYHYFDIRQIIGIEYDKSYSKLLAIGKKSSDKDVVLFPTLENYLHQRFHTYFESKNKLLEQFKPMSFRKIQQNLLLFCLGEPTENNIGEQIFDETLKVYKNDTLFYKMSTKLVKNMSLKIQKQLENTTIDRQKFIEFIINQYRKTRHIGMIYLGAFALLIDAYLIPRMFRTYDDKTKSKRAAPGCHTNISKNIIVYAGYNHIETYYDYFDTVHGIKPTINIKYKEIIGTGMNKCINIPHIQPFGIPIFDKKYSSEYQLPASHWK